MNKNVRYDRLRTLDDVRAERRRIQREIARKEGDLQDDVENLSEVLTLSFWTGVVQDKVAAWLPMSPLVNMGYGLLTSLAKKHKKRKRRKKRKKKAQELAAQCPK